MPDAWWEKDMREAQRRGFWSGLFVGVFGSIVTFGIVVAALAHFQ